MRILIDECLHTSLTEVANEAGYEAHHVVYRGWAGLKDYERRAIVLREEFVFATNNGRHFRELLEQVDLHPDLVIIIPNVKPRIQRDLFRLALERIKPLPNMVNKVVELYSAEDIRIYDLPKLQ